MILTTIKIAVRPFGMFPIRTDSPPPPLRKIVEVHRSVGHREDERPGHQLLTRRSGRPRRQLRQNLLDRRNFFGSRHVPGRFHECGELRVRHLRLVDPEAIDARPMRGLLIRPAEFRIGPHRELATGNPGHARHRSHGWLDCGLLGDRVTHRVLIARRVPNPRHGKHDGERSQAYSQHQQVVLHADTQLSS